MGENIEKEEGQQRRFTVFISYRHLDNRELRRQWATWLHQALETYEIPVDLIGKKNIHGESIPKSLYPVFRDEEELSADPEYKKNIYRALTNSALLVVICSPRAAASEYVDEEVRYFKQLGRANHILAMIIDGEPYVSTDPARMHLECLPKSLRYGVVRDDGSLDWSEPTQLIAADTRPEGKPTQGWTTGAGYRESLEFEKQLTPKAINEKVAEYEKRLQLAKLKVVAGALGLELGVVTERDKEWQFRRARERALRFRKLAAAFAGLALAALVAGIVALHEKVTAVTTLSKSDFLQAGRFIGENNRGDALAYLVRSIKENPKNWDAVTRLTTLLTYHAWMVPTLILAHTNTVEWAEFSQDGKRIVTASDNHCAQIWDAQTGFPVSNPLTNNSIVWHCAFSSDGKMVATASADKTAKVWNAETGQLLHTYTHSNQVYWVSFSPDGEKIATASWDKTARVWNAKTGEAVTGFLTNSDSLEYVEFSPDGSSIVTADDGGLATVWDARTGKPVGLRMTNYDIVVSAKFSPDGERVVTASWDSIARVWDTKSGKQLLGITNNGGVEWAEFSPDGNRIVTGTKNNSARVWDAKTGRPLTDAMKHSSAVYLVRYSPDGKRIATASMDYTARVWDAKTGEPLSEPLKHANFVNCIQFSPDGKRLLTASYDGTARVWEMLSGPALPIPLPEDGILSSEFSPDGSKIVTASADHTARVWDSLNGLEQTLPMTNGNLVLSAHFSPDGKSIVTASEDNSARIWDAKTGAQVGEKMTNSGAVNSANFSPDGRWIVTASKDRTARIWDAKTGRQFGNTMFHSNTVWLALFSPDGKRIVTGSGKVDEVGWVSPSTNGMAQLWDVQTTTEIKLNTPILHNGAVISAQFSPDGKRIVTGSKDYSARVWDAQTGAPISPAIPHGHVVASVQFSPDGKQILTASADHTARVWDAISGFPLTEPLIQSGSMLMARFSPDAKWIASAAKDQAVQIWGTQTAQPLTEPFLHLGPLYTVQFNPEGSRIVTAAKNDMARVWDIAPAPAEYPDWLLPLAEAVAGETLSQDGVLTLIGDRYKRLSVLKEKIIAESTNSEWNVWGRWFFSDSWSRAMSPFAHVTLVECISALIREPTSISLNEASRLALRFGNTNLLKQIEETQKKMGD